MINLIPPAGHRVVKREYILRVGATYAFLFGLVCFVLGVAYVPTYVLIKAQIDTMSIVTERERGEGETLKIIENEIRMTHEVLTQLQSVKDSITPSDAIGAIEKATPTGVSFKTFTISETKGNITAIQVQGVATTRETLIRFKRDVEELEIFSTAEVPISDLAKDTNLPFTMTVSLVQEKKQ